MEMSLRDNISRSYNWLAITSDRMHATIFDFGMTFSIIFCISSISKSTISILRFSPKRTQTFKFRVLARFFLFFFFRLFCFYQMNPEQLVAEYVLHILVALLCSVFF